VAVAFFGKLNPDNNFYAAMGFFYLIIDE